jgi:hypothetical protein
MQELLGETLLPDYRLLELIRQAVYLVHKCEDLCSEDIHKFLRIALELIENRDLLRRDRFHCLREALDVFDGYEELLRFLRLVGLSRVIQEIRIPMGVILE